MDFGEKPKVDTLRIAALVVASCSLLFAIFVLFPWHLELSAEMKELTKICKQAIR